MKALRNADVQGTHVMTGTAFGPLPLTTMSVAGKRPGAREAGHGWREMDKGLINTIYGTKKFSV